MVVYVGFLASGSAVGPILAGPIASGLHSWRWLFGISSIAIGINLITCVLMLPETTHFMEDYPIGDSTTDTPVGKNDISCLEDVNSSGDSMHAREVYSLKSLWIERSFFLRLGYVKEKENLIKLFLAPFPLLLAPAVLAGTIIFGLLIGWTALTSIVVSNVFSAPPLSWQPWQVGLINFGPLLGLLVGLPLGGVLADSLSTTAARKAKGEHDPRSRLPAVIIGALISPAGCLVIGFSLQNHLHWIGIAIGWAMLAFGLTASANILLTYSVDCFRERAGHVGVLVNVVKNGLAFGVSFASMDWFNKVGPAAQFGTMAGMLWVGYLAIIPIYFYSPVNR